MAKKRVETEEDRKILERFEKDFERGQSDCKTLQTEYTKDKRFVFDHDQWETEEQDARKGRPTLTINKTLQFVMQVANDARQNNPAIKILPATEGASEKLARVRGGLIRSVERNSNAKAARQHALLDAIGAGYGFYRIVTDYEAQDSFDQEIKVKRVLDASIITWDNDAQEPDFSDAMFYVLQEPMSKEKFKAEFNKEATDFMTGKVSTAWGNREMPTVSEYWYVEMVPDTLYKMVNEENKFASELTKLAAKQGLEEIPDELYAKGEDGARISRPTQRRQVKWCKLAGGQVLSKRDWPGYWIPIIPVLGRETLIAGRRKLNSLIRPAKDSQRMLNYARSAQAERLSLTSKAPWIVAEESIATNRQAQWNTSNTKAHGALYYKAYDASGRALPQPKRGEPVQVDMGLVQESQTSTQELKETTGIYESGLGAKGNETSGRAILAREKQGDTATYDFTDNLSVAIRFEGMILNDLIPHVWDTPRQIRILGEDDAEEVIWVNKQAQDAAGNEYHHDLSQGKFSVAVTVGPAYATKRQETAESMLDLMKALPPEMSAIFSDLAIREQDWRGSSTAADRAKKWVAKAFPGLVEEDKPKEGEPKPPDPELMQAHQQMDQMHNIIEQMQGQLAELAQKDKHEMAKLDLEWFKAETDRFSAEAAAKVQDPSALIAQIKAEADIEREHVKAAGNVLSSRIQADASQPSLEAAPTDIGPTDASESAQPPLE